MGKSMFYPLRGFSVPVRGKIRVLNYTGRGLMVEAGFGKSTFEFSSGKKLLQIGGVTFGCGIPQLGRCS